MKKLLTLCSICFAVVLAGCASHQKLSNELITSLKQGNALKAHQTIQDMKEEFDDSEDGLLYCLETAAAYRILGDFEQSNRILEEVERRYAKIQEKAKVSVSDEAAAAFTNQRSRPYNGYAYDHIMASTYKAMNCLAAGQMDKARVEFKRLLQKQRDAVQKFAKDIEKKKVKSKKYDVEKAQSNPKFKQSLARATAGSAGVAAYASYVNPFSVYLDGIFYLHTGVDGNDLEHAKKSLERLTQLAPNCGPVIEEDLKILDSKLNGGDPVDTKGLTYVVFETGMAPSKGQTKIDVPLFLVSRRVSYIGAAIPKLVFHNKNYLSSLSVTANGSSLKTSPVCDMDRVVKTEFDAELPKVIALTLVSTAVKATAAYAAEKAVERQNLLVKIITKLTVIGYQAAMNNADLRCWRLLPKQFQIARVKVGDDGKVALQAGLQNKSVSVDPNKINVIVVKSMGANTPLNVHSFSLN